METRTFKVKGMHCSSCETILKESIEEIPGVEKAEASTKKGSVTVTFDPKKADETKFKPAIEKEGYSVR